MGCLGGGKGGKVILLCKKKTRNKAASNQMGGMSDALLESYGGCISFTIKRIGCEKWRDRWGPLDEILRMNG